jgi:alpha-L-fucosidase
MLAEECQQQGIKLFFYHSQLDWHHPDYYPLGETGQFSGRTPGGSWNRYLDYMDGQLQELLTNYGEIGGIWFDGWWDKKTADWRLDKTYSLIHSLQPQALIGSNHHRKPFPGEDFQMFEKDLPGFNTTGFNQESEIGNLPLETCETINNSWGYNKSDRSMKSTKDLVHYLVRAAGYNSNFLLNIGPMPNGRIQSEFVERLKAVGEWMSQNGDSIYGSRGGPITPRPWGVTTTRKDKVYIHILDWKDSELVIPKLPSPVKTAKLLKDGRRVIVNETLKGLLLSLPDGELDPIDTIVVLEF